MHTLRYYELLYLHGALLGVLVGDAHLTIFGW